VKKNNEVIVKAIYKQILRALYKK